MNPDKKITWQEMCETIVRAGILRKSDGTSPTAREIFDHAPGGELYHVWMWYWEAERLLAAREGRPIPPWPTVEEALAGSDAPSPLV